MPAEDQAIGARAREAREQRGFSQEQVAAALKISRTSLTRAEQGVRKITAVELKGLAGFLGIKADSLLGDDRLLLPSKPRPRKAQP
jgi:transcriptional regulator with XRE-family HTH domain